MEQSMLVTMRDEILGPELYAALYKGPPEDGLIFPNGSRIAFRGLDQPRRIQGMRYGFAGCDQAEELAEEQFTILDAGCTQVGMPWTQTFLAFNPDGPSHWAYLRYRPDDGDGPRYWADGAHFADVVHVKHDDGLHILTPQQLAKLDRMTGVAAQRLRFGKWVHFEGLVFDSFDPSFHVKHAPAEWTQWDGLPPPTWPRYRGIDFGFVHPWACVWIAQAPAGSLGVYRYALRTKLTPGDQIGMILEAEQDELRRLRHAADPDWARANEVYLSSLNLVGSWSDHDASLRAEYASRGVWTQLAKKDDGGIETLRELLDPRYVDAAGYPQLWIMEGAQMGGPDPLLVEAKKPASLQEEFARYRWETRKMAGGDRRTKDKPEKIDDDAIDALRYLCDSMARSGSIGIY